MLAEGFTNFNSKEPQNVAQDLPKNPVNIVETSVHSHTSILSTYWFIAQDRKERETSSLISPFFKFWLPLDNLPLNTQIKESQISTLSHEHPSPLPPSIFQSRSSASLAAIEHYLLFSWQYDNYGLARKWKNNQHFTWICWMPCKT